MARALNLVQSLGVGKVSGSHFDVSAGASTQRRTIKVETAKVNYVLGIDVPEEEMVRILKNLAYPPGSGTGQTPGCWSWQWSGFQNIPGCTGNSLRTAKIYCGGELVGTFGQLRYDVIDSLAIAKDKKAVSNVSFMV